jgi:hypothetical protein
MTERNFWPLAGTVSLAAVWISPAGGRADPVLAGTYIHTGDIPAMMVVHVSKGIADVRLDGGGNRRAGASSAADCGIHAVGPVMPSGVVADFHAMESDTMDYDEVLAKQEHRKISITFSGGGAEVLSADTDGYCGLGANFTGHYKRR